MEWAGAAARGLSALHSVIHAATVQLSALLPQFCQAAKAVDISQPVGFDTKGRRPEESKACKGHESDAWCDMIDVELRVDVLRRGIRKAFSGETIMNARWDVGYYAWLIFAGVLTYVIHEGAHWLVGEGLGYRMAASLNSARALSPTTATHAALISAAGPVITIVQGLVAYLWIRAGAGTAAFAFLLWAAFMRVVASGISLFMPNDEARVSSFLGLGTWTLPLVVSAGLVALTWVAARKLRMTWKPALGTYLIASIVSALVVGGDAMLAR